MEIEDFQFMFWLAKTNHLIIKKRWENSALFNELIFSKKFENT